MSYLGDFLFSPERAHSPVRTLSGGERNRLLLARLFALPANVLVLDEPTNDLDIETLELLEELLQGYAGTVLLVSHDRALPRQRGDQHDRLGGRRSRPAWREYEGGYEDWQRQRARAPRPRRGRPRRRARLRTRPSPPPDAAARAAPTPQAAQAQLQGAATERCRRASRRSRPSRRSSASCSTAPLYADDPARAEAAQVRYAQIETS